MKFFTLLALVGFASAVRLNGDADLKWQPNHEYTYSYRGRLLTGLPELSGKHFSGMGIHAKIHLNVISPERVALSVSQAEYTRFNRELEPASASQDGYNWRFLPLPGYEPVPSETLRYLREPTVFELNSYSGKVERVIVSGEEPEWSVNFKKALVALFQTQGGETGSIRSNSLSDYVNEQPSTPFQNYWTTMEESVDGECETRYEMNELPESRIYDEEIVSGLKRSSGEQSSSERLVDGPVSLPSSCRSGSKIYEITKVRNVNKCVRRSSFSFYKPGGYDCTQYPTGSGSKMGNCEGMTSRSSITKYLVCGRSEYDYVIVKIVNEGELNQDLLGFKSEKMLTGTRQEIKLLEKRSGVSNSESELTPSSPKTLESLFYEYSVKKSPEQLKEELSHGNESMMKKMTFPMKDASSKKEMIKEEMKSLLKKMVNHDLFTTEGLPETQVSLKALGISKGFHALSLDDIEQLYHTLKSEFSNSEDKHYVFKNIYFDTCMMSGTVSSVRFLKKMILKGEMSPHMAQSMFLSLASSVITPVTPLLEELYELVTSEKVKELSRENNLYNSAVLGYSSLIEKACLSINRNTSYPTEVFGRFCHHDSVVVTEKWIPYLTRGIRHESSSIERKNLYVVALGLLSHKQVVPALTYVLNTPSESESSPLLRTLAVYSLSKVGRHHPRYVQPILCATFCDRNQRTEVRVAAFNVLMKLSPESTYLQMIGTSTWVETDLEILKLVNTAFYSLSGATAMQDIKPESASLVRRVRLLYPLIRKTGGRFPTTGSVYLNDYLKHLNVGFEKMMSWTAPKDSPLPTNLYSKLSYFMDNYRYTPLEYGLHLRGSGSLIKEIIEIITGKSSVKSSSEESSYGSESEEIVNKITGEWRKIVEKLNIEPRRDTERPEGALFVNVFETYPIFKSFAMESTESLKHQVKEMLRKGPMSSGSYSNLISYQRTLNLAPTIVQIPSDMGLPIVIETHMPLVLSLKGRFEPESFNLNKVSLKSKFHAMASVQYSGWVGTVCPFTGDYVRTGIDQHASVNFPNEFYVELDRSQQEIKVRMEVSPSSMTSGASKVELFHYHVNPFTVRQKIYELKPLTLASTYKVIKSNDFPRQRSEYQPEPETIPIFKTLGLGMTLSYVKPVPHRSAAPTLIEKFRMYNENPMNILRFILVSTAVSPVEELPSIRSHFIKVVHHPQSASTKAIETSFKYGIASKSGEGKPIMYHTLEKKSGMSSGSRGLSSGLKVKSHPIGEVSKHPVRQEKIKSMIEKIENNNNGSPIKSGYGLSFSVTTKLISSSRSIDRSWTYTLLAALGKNAEIKTQWNVRLESDEHKMFCAKGSIDMPLTSVYDVEKILSEENRYKFESKIGFGQSCDDKILKVIGYTKTSEEQKNIARESRSTQELKKLIAHGAPLAEVSQVAEKVRKIATSLDEVVYEIEYTRLPESYVFYGEKVVEFLKLYWLPYRTYRSEESSSGSYLGSIRSYLTRSSESSYESEEESSVHSARSIESMLSGSPSSGKVVYKIKFHPRRQTFSLTIERSTGERITFSDVKIPYPVSYYFPFYSAYSPVYGMEKTLTGLSYNPVCKVEGNSMVTYDNETLPLKEMTKDCYHLLTTECATQGEWSVLIRRSHKVPTYKIVKVIVHNVDIKMIPERRESMTIEVRGSPISLRKGGEKVIYGENSEVIGKVQRYNDETYVFLSKYFNLAFNGYSLEVTPSLVYKSKMCGLCGNYNGDKSDELLSPRMCLVSKPKVFVDSYAIPESRSSSCLSESAKEELRKETEERCVKVSPSSGITHSVLRKASRISESSEESEYERITTYRTPTYESEYESSSPSSSGMCYRRSHHVLYRGNKVCISRRPFNTCSEECKRVSERMVPEIKFHCFRHGTPIADHYIQRVYSGEEIPELRTMSVDIVRDVHVPTSCKPTNY